MYVINVINAGGNFSFVLEAAVTFVNDLWDSVFRAMISLVDWLVRPLRSYIFLFTGHENDRKTFIGKEKDYQILVPERNFVLKYCLHFVSGVTKLSYLIYP